MADAERYDLCTSGAAGCLLLIAESVRHLQLDPLLPEELLPGHWPGPALRERYTRFRDDYAGRLRQYSRE